VNIPGAGEMKTMMVLTSSAICVLCFRLLKCSSVFFFVHSPLSLSFSFSFFSRLLSSILLSLLSSLTAFFSFLRSSSLCFLFFTFPSPSVFSFLCLVPFFFSFCSVHPLAFIARGCRRFHLFLQGQSNGRRASWWREISAMKHAPLIEANQRLRCCNVSRPAARNDSEQCSVKRHRFATLNDISDLVLGCFCKFIIKPPKKL